jgi:hypothetical protein
MRKEEELKVPGEQLPKRKEKDQTEYFDHYEGSALHPGKMWKHC